jgi:hypothetical protein
MHDQVLDYQYMLTQAETWSRKTSDTKGSVNSSEYSGDKTSVSDATQVQVPPTKDIQMMHRSSDAYNEKRKANRATLAGNNSSGSCK